MVTTVPYVIRSEYPHMGVDDAQVWTRFIKLRPLQYDTVAYDVKVGTPPPFVESGEFAIGGDTRNLYLRKIDVIGLRGRDVDIIEVKTDAGFAAIGQIRGYMMLYRQTFPGAARLTPVIICSSMRPDVRTMAEIDGIEVFIV